MKRPTPLEVMRYSDGEANQDEARRVEHWLTESSEARAQLDGFRQIGDFVRASASSRHIEFDIAGDVMSRLDEPRAEPTPPPRPLASIRRRKDGFLRAAPFLGAAALAAAAAVALLVAPEARQPEGGAPEERPALLAHGPPAAANPVEGTDTPGAEIEAIEFGGEGGSLFLVAGAADLTPVVWLVDDAGDKSGRMEPL